MRNGEVDGASGAGGRFRPSEALRGFSLLLHRTIFQSLQFPTHLRADPSSASQNITKKKNELEKLQRSQGALGRTVSAPRRRQRASKSSPCLFRVMLTVSAPPFLPLTCEVLAKLTTHSDSRAEKVLVLTSDSRTLVGMLLSCDQMTNLVFLSVSLFSF
jgi:hypothetical protein